jgi:phospholipase C
VPSDEKRDDLPRELPHVMGYDTADGVPISRLFVRNVVVCDRWFAALPAGTQPNRLRRCRSRG